MNQKSPRKWIFPLFVLAVAASLWWWIPYQMKQPGPAYHKILVATDKGHEGAGDKSVMLIVSDDGHGSLGLLLNGPAPTRKGEPHLGGPVKADVSYTLHSLDLAGSDTIKMSDIGIGYTPGDFFPVLIKKMGDRPFDYLFFKGYTGWERGQLKKEIEAGSWKVVNFDKNLVFHVAPADMWAAAMKLPAAPPAQ